MCGAQDWMVGDEPLQSLDREELEGRLHRYREQFSRLVETASGTVVRLGSDGTVESVDESVRSLLGVDPASLEGQPFASLVPEGETTGTILGDSDPVELVASLADTDGQLELPLTGPDGRSRPVQVSGVTLEHSDAYLCVLYPGDDHRATRRDQTDDLVDAVGDPLYVLDADGAIERVNDAMVEYTGYERDELVGRAIGEIIPSPEYDRATDRLASLATVEEGESDTFETTLVTKDGELIHSEAKVTVLTNDDDEFVGSVGVLRDIRGRKQRERDLELLKQVVTRVFRHNIRNELTVVQTNAELLERQTDDDTAEYTRAILDTCRRLLAHSEKARLMQQVLDTDKQSETDIGEMVRELAEAASARDAEATVDVDVGTPTTVRAHPNISKAVEELIDNAIKHAPDEQPVVRIWTDETEAFRTLFIEDESGGLADEEIEVLRTGEESELEHGSGVGLWLVRWLVDHSNAKMIAHRTESGSLMGIRFPRHDRNVDSTVARLDDDTPFTRAPPHVRELSPERFRGETVVGRMEELHRLEDTYDAVTRTGGHAVLVGGETGVGKTTLVKQFQRRLTENDDPPLLATGTCESGMTPPYHALRLALADLPVETALEETLAGVVPASSDDPETVEQRRQAMFTDVAETLRDLAMDHPVVLVVEDLQWADPGTVDLLRYLIDEVGQWALPILFVGTYRTGEIRETHPIVEIAAETAETGRGTVLELEPFDPVDVRNLLAYMLDVEDIPESFVSTVQDHTGGTPLFVAEIGRQLAESLGPTPDRTELPEDLDAVALPASVENAVTDRIDSLYDPVRSVLELGAVVGDTVSFDVLRDASDCAETELVEYVDRLVGKHIWERTGGELVFVHGVIRDKVLEQIDSQQTTARHARVAQAIERVNAGSLDEHYGRLAMHYDASGETAIAIEYYRQAGERAADAYAHEDAITSYDRALTLATEGETDAAAVATLYGDLAEVLRTVGDLDSARAAGQQGLGVTDEESREACRLLGIVAAVQTDQGDLREASQTTERQRELAVGLGLDNLEAEAVRRLGVLEKNQGAFDRARDCYEEALALADGDREFEATVRKELGVVAWRQGEYDTARTFCEESLRIARELGVRSLEAACLNNLGGVTSRTGDYDQAQEYHEESLRIKRDIGDRKGESYSLNNLGELLARQGAYDQAREFYEESLHVKRDIGDSRGQSETLINLGIAARHQGEYEQARTYHEEGLGIAREIGERLREAKHLVNVAEVQRECGQTDEARQYFTEALAIARELDNPVEKIDTLRGLGALARDRGAHEQARGYFEDALAIGDQTEHPTEVGRTHLEAARLALATGDTETARSRVTRARETFEGLGASLWRGQCRVLEGQIATTGGNPSAAVDHWKRALDTFADVGAPQHTLATLRLLVEQATEQGERERARDWWREARARLRDAPEPVVEQNKEWVDRHATHGEQA